MRRILADLNPKGVRRMNKYAQVVAKDFAEDFVRLGRVALGANRVPELSLDQGGHVANPNVSDDAPGATNAGAPKKLVPSGRLELPTLGLLIPSSIQLRYEGTRDGRDGQCLSRGPSRPTLSSELSASPHLVADINPALVHALYFGLPQEGRMDLASRGARAEPVCGSQKGAN